MKIMQFIIKFTGFAKKRKKQKWKRANRDVKLERFVIQSPMVTKYPRRLTTFFQWIYRVSKPHEKSIVLTDQKVRKPDRGGHFSFTSVFSKSMHTDLDWSAPPMCESQLDREAATTFPVSERKWNTSRSSSAEGPPSAR